MRKLVTILAMVIAYTTGYSQYNYLGSYTSDGTPIYFTTSDNISTATMNLVKNALPEGFPVPIYNPQYISSGYDSDIILIDSADVWVTFIDEGAGYKNVLGFYTYDINSPLTTAPPASAVTIIFPNVSKAGSGGSLVAGNKVKIGTFSPNTGIGFILIADGWRNGAVSNGNWKVYSNPAFNPETNASLRYHNALISDSTNQRIILGFEDIRRDYGSCDNDFNDALFYISANPYSAIQTSNYAPIESANREVTSGNSGGLESDGRLAQRVAKLFFNRQKNNNDKKALKENQNSFRNTLSRPLGDSVLTLLSGYLPSAGMFGNEQSFISTPTDLLTITNATEVFSADYYVASKRVAAALATRTSGSVYNHTKVICDRLNNSSLEDVRTILLGNYKLINSTLKKADGEIEYSITFSVQVLTNEYRVHSFWNVEQYPAGEYLNFQVWGSSMGQVCSITNEILKKLETEKAVTSIPEQTKIPKVFIKKGVYKNGKLYLTVCNKPKVTAITLTGNSTNTETGYLHPLSLLIPLNGSLYQEVEVNTGAIFDIGFSITYPNNLQQDGLYLADGAWGVDYESALASNISFIVADDASDITEDKLSVERNPEVSGKIKGIVNLFRNAKAGNLPLDISNYKQLSFDVQSTSPVEVILVSNELVNWAERARYTIPAAPTGQQVDILLTKFTDNNAQPVVLSKIKTIVFSIKGDNTSFTNFKLNVSNVNFNNEEARRVAVHNNAVIFPNPFADAATIAVPKEINSGTLQINDVAGKIVLKKEVVFNNGGYALDTKTFQTGTYFFTVITGDNKLYKGKFIIRK